MTKSRDFFSVLRRKLNRQLPSGFDERFWKKFDHKKQKWRPWGFFQALSMVGVPTLMILGFIMWRTSLPPKIPVPARSHDFLSDISIAQLSEEDFEVTLNLEVLDLSETNEEEDLYPSDEEEWTKFFEEPSSG